MKLKFWISLCVFISSYFPLALIFALQDFDYSRFRLQHPLPIFVTIVFSCICIIFTWLALFVPRWGRRGTQTIKITNVSLQSATLINYSLPYAVSFFSIKLDDPGSVLSFLVFMAIMFSLSYLTDTILLNPLFILFGYKLYDINYRIVGKTQEHHGLLLSADASLRTDDNCRVYEIGKNFMILTVKNPEV